MKKLKSILGKVWAKVYPVLFFLFIELKDFFNLFLRSKYFMSNYNLTL